MLHFCLGYLKALTPYWDKVLANLKKKFIPMLFAFRALY